MGTPANSMSDIQGSGSTWTPETDAEKRAVSQQLDRILASSLFKNSKRYPKMLRFVVERSLEGHAEPFKERILGLEVFGREPDYDTNLDPVVRMTAVEIRKRIAQYYHEGGHEGEIRIDFPAGSYLPEYRLPMAPRPLAPMSPSVDVTKTNKPPLIWPLKWILVSLAVMLLSALVLHFLRAATALESFWEPVLNSREPVSFYMGPSYAEGSPESAVSISDLNKAERVGFADATALVNITTFLGGQKKPYRIRLQIDGRMDELKEGPALFIGGFSNSFTLRLNNQARYNFVRVPGSHVVGIRDRQAPDSTKWFRSNDLPYASLKEDYAIVSRVLDPTTGHVAITAAGLSKYGTAAAGEFLGKPEFLEQFSAKAPKDWYRKNMQLVLSTSVVGTSAGPPQVIAMYFW